VALSGLSELRTHKAVGCKQQFSKDSHLENRSSVLLIKSSEIECIRNDDLSHKVKEHSRETLKIVSEFLNLTIRTRLRKSPNFFLKFCFILNLSIINVMG